MSLAFTDSASVNTQKEKASVSREWTDRLTGYVTLMMALSISGPRGITENTMADTTEVLSF